MKGFFGIVRMTIGVLSIKKCLLPDIGNTKLYIIIIKIYIAYITSSYLYLQTEP